MESDCPPTRFLGRAAPEFAIEPTKPALICSFGTIEFSRQYSYLNVIRLAGTLFWPSLVEKGKF